MMKCGKQRRVKVRREGKTNLPRPRGVQVDLVIVTKRKMSLP